MLIDAIKITRQHKSAKDKLLKLKTIHKCINTVTTYNYINNSFVHVIVIYINRSLHGKNESRTVLKPSVVI